MFSHYRTPVFIENGQNICYTFHAASYINAKTEVFMARYIQDVTLNQPDDFVHFMMNDYLQKNSFSNSTKKGPSVYRRGDGFFEGFRYMTYSYANGVLHLEAWMAGPFGGEQGLTGFWGWAVKSSYRKDIERLISLLLQNIPQAAAVPGQTPDGAPSTQSVIPVQTMDNTGAAKASLIFGILSIVLCWTYFSVVFTCLAVIFYRSSKHSTKAGMAKAGLICGIVGSSIWLFLVLLQFVLIFLGIMV